LVGRLAPSWSAQATRDKQPANDDEYGQSQEWKPAFHGFTNPIAQKETLPLNLIRMYEPYVDTQPVSAAPIKPDETRDFRLIFDHISQDWNQQYPEIRVIQVSGK